jgi:pyruvate dehydrogenase complex dehydrogenase (E1) component
LTEVVKATQVQAETNGSIIAATDWVRAVPESVRAYRAIAMP